MADSFQLGTSTSLPTCHGFIKNSECMLRTLRAALIGSPPLPFSLSWQLLGNVDGRLGCAKLTTDAHTDTDRRNLAKKVLQVRLLQKEIKPTLFFGNVTTVHLDDYLHLSRQLRQIFSEAPFTCFINVFVAVHCYCETSFCNLFVPYVRRQRLDAITLYH